MGEQGQIGLLGQPLCELWLRHTATAEEATEALEASEALGALAEFSAARPYLTLLDFT